MENITIFQTIVFNIIKIIVSTFPASSNFEMDDILSSEICPDDEKREEYCYNTIQWLKANNFIYIRSEELSYGSWERVFPTEKMLALMNVKLPTLDNSTLLTAISKIKEIGEKGASEVAQEVVKNFINADATATIGYIGGAI